jgi:hypothetical protein
MADQKINTATQQNPKPIAIGTAATDAMAGDKMPWTFLVRITSGSGAVQMYTQRVIPAGTWLAFNLQYRSGSAEGGISFTAATGFSLDGVSVRGASGYSGDCAFVAGYFSTTSAVPVNSWVTIGTASKTANNTFCGMGVRY